MELTTKRSNFWYILPIVLGLLGGVITYFILRKSDSKKAKICIIIGFAISAIWIGAIASSDTSPETSELKDTSPETQFRGTEKTQEEKIAEQERIDQEIAESLRAGQNQAYLAKLVSDEEMDRRLAELESNKFDPIIVQSALENIPGMQALPREVLEQCKAVKSFSDYQIFTIAVSLMSEDFITTLELMDAVLSLLELEGYDKHPKVGPLIKETRSLAGESSDCIVDLVNRYG